MDIKDVRSAIRKTIKHFSNNFAKCIYHQYFQVPWSNQDILYDVNDAFVISVLTGFKPFLTHIDSYQSSLLWTLGHSDATEYLFVLACDYNIDIGITKEEHIMELCTLGITIIKYDST